MLLWRHDSRIASNLIPAKNRVQEPSRLRVYIKQLVAVFFLT